jgi:Asp-tRNA(Asn)/Glu-tRNA(Gln) amidotransferase C subunit
MNDYTEYIIQTAKLLDLEIAPENLTSVVNNFATIAKIASLVTEFPLSQDTESASVFEP